jgi:hypothetical protein
MRGGKQMGEIFAIMNLECELPPTFLGNWGCLAIEVEA